jgi:hypothetical protein
VSIRIVCPYVELRDETKRALTAYAPQTEYVDTSADPFAYWRLLKDLWGAGSDFLLVEQDIEIHAQVVPELEACPELWCAFPYELAPDNRTLTASLGCTRFRADLMHHQQMECIAPGFRHWNGLDHWLLLDLYTRGHRPHLHFPEVLHHHTEPRGPVLVIGEGEGVGFVIDRPAPPGSLILDGHVFVGDEIPPNLLADPNSAAAKLRASRSTVRSDD